MSTYAPVLIEQQRFSSLEQVKRLYKEHSLEGMLRAVGMNAENMDRVLRHIGDMTFEAPSSLPPSQEQTHIRIPAESKPLRKLTFKEVEKVFSYWSIAMDIDIRLQGQKDGRRLVKLTKDGLSKLLSSKLTDDQLDELLDRIHEVEIDDVPAEMFN